MVLTLFWVSHPKTVLTLKSKSFSNLTSSTILEILFWDIEGQKLAITVILKSIVHCKGVKFLRFWSSGFHFSFGMRHSVFLMPRCVVNVYLAWDSSTVYKQETVFANIHDLRVTLAQASLQCHVAFFNIICQVKYGNGHSLIQLHHYWISISNESTALQLCERILIFWNTNYVSRIRF